MSVTAAVGQKSRVHCCPPTSWILQCCSLRDFCGKQFHRPRIQYSLLGLSSETVWPDLFDALYWILPEKLTGSLLWWQYIHHQNHISSFHIIIIVIFTSPCFACVRLKQTIKSRNWGRPPERGTFFRLQVHERVENSLVEVKRELAYYLLLKYKKG